MREEDIKRSRAKALDLLQYNDRTEAELRRKLKDKEFTDEQIDDAVAYCYSYHYLDDVRYAEHFIRNHRLDYSSMVLRQKLMLKGVDQSDITEAFGRVTEDSDEDTGELDAAVKALSKRIRSLTADDPAEGQKLLAYMYRKGFTPDITRRAIETLKSDNTDDMA